jgi:L-lactate dehydrogenase complex protein LldF
MKFQPIDQFAAGRCRPEKRPRSTTAPRRRTRSARSCCSTQFAEPEPAAPPGGRDQAARVENLDTYLPLAEEAEGRRGAGPLGGRRRGGATPVLAIMQRRGATRLVKAKTMVSEEIELAPFL